MTSALRSVLVILHWAGGVGSLDTVRSTPVSGKRTLRNQYPPVMPILHGKEVRDDVSLSSVVLSWQPAHPILP